MHDAQMCLAMSGFSNVESKRQVGQLQAHVLVQASSHQLSIISFAHILHHVRLPHLLTQQPHLAKIWRQNDKAGRWIALLQQVAQHEHCQCCFLSVDLQDKGE